MLLWICYTVITFIFLLVTFATVHIGGFVTVLLLTGIAGCFTLNVIASPRFIFEPQRGLRIAFTGCLLMLPLFAFALLPTYGIPMALLLLVMYYTRVMIRRDPSPGQMLRYTTTWRVKLATGFWAAFVTFVLIALLLGCFKLTSDILPVEGGGVILWR